MNKNKIKSYAPVARNELIAAVTAKAQVLGLSATKIEPIESKGDVAIIAGRPFPRSVIGPRSNLESAIKREGFGQLMERIAFTWFNRFTALRYMEIQGFLDHGYRVLSHPKGGAIPEVLEHATEVDLIGLDKGKVAELRLGGQKDAELYRMLLIAQCNTLHPALPFLFEMSNDATELLLPDNLLHTDSPIRKLVSEIDEADWSQVEIIGWLYQFYISEKKDAVIGKVVKSEDIPAATQLFTPNWIVKYLVQNTLGRQWLATYPQSGLRAKMEFYIEPAEQTDEVKTRLREITPTELNPEDITFFDPACGSGHILVEAYDLFKRIYEERGYARRDIPRLILEKNLFGLDIDERAAQLSCFALMMKARADERGLFKSDPQVRPNVLAIQESNGLDGDEIARVLTREKIEKLVDSETQLQQTSSSAPGGKIGKPLLSVAHKPDIDGGGINALLTLFENAKTFGSLIHVPEGIAKFLPFFERLIDPTLGRDLIGIRAAEELRPLVRQAKFLSSLFDHVVANPPFMGNKYLNPLLKDFLKKNFKDFEKDLFSCFMIRNFDFGENSALLGFVSPFVWMFISSYEKLREFLFSRKSILSLVRPSYTAFFESAIVPLVTFVCTNNVEGVLGDYFDLGYLGRGDEQAPRFLESLNTENNPTRFRACKDDFRKIPGSTIAYWVSERIREIFEKGTPLGRIADPRQGMATTDNKLYLRYWFEPSIARIGFGLTNREEALLSRKKWFPYNKGGSFRKWYGNNDYVVDWEKDGERIKSSVIEKYPYLK